MPISNLAKVFGPTLVGYSSQKPSPTSLLSETNNQVAVSIKNEKLKILINVFILIFLKI